MLRNVVLLTAVTVAFAPSGSGLVAGAQDDAAIKGVFREGKRSGVKVSVFATDGNKRRRVSTDYEFRSGDSFELELETNQRAYVYVLNRTLAGDPSSLGSKGIERIRDDDRRERPPVGPYQLLYPMKNDPRVAESNKPFKLTGFRMDDKPGVEKMFVVVSAKPIDISRYFDVDGDQRTGNRPPSSGGDRGRREDRDEDVLDQLNKDLADWSANAESVLPKGVERDPEGYGVVRDPAKPGVVELTLLHYGASRRR
jgi:hypothetical protein